MMLRIASTGVFLGCSSYSLPPKERCTQTMNLLGGDEAVDLDADDEGESKALRKKRRCEICNATMESYLLDEKRKVHVCSNAPDCSGFAIEAGVFRLKGYEGPTLECDKCGAEMQLKSGRFGKYFGCGVQKHAEAPAQRSAGAAEDDAHPHARASVPEGRRYLRAARRGGGALSGCERLSQKS